METSRKVFYAFSVPLVVHAVFYVRNGQTCQNQRTTDLKARKRNKTEIKVYIRNRVFKSGIKSPSLGYR